MSRLGQSRRFGDQRRSAAYSIILDLAGPGGPVCLKEAGYLIGWALEGGRRQPDRSCEDVAGGSVRNTSKVQHDCFAQVMDVLAKPADFVECDSSGPQS